MESNGSKIDLLYGQLLSLCQDPDLGFSELGCDWGKGDGYNKNYARYCRAMRRLAKNCPVKCVDKVFYLFNGRIYSPVDDIVVIGAYNLLIEHLNISAAFGRKSLCETVFLQPIRDYNVLNTRFELMAFSNGVVDFGMDSPQLYPFSPEFHVTYYHPYAYNPKASCDRWLSFLHEVLPDRNSRLILQMFLGLGLISRGDAFNPYTGKVSDKVELCLLLIGSGANGKSVIFEVACALFGREKVSKMDYSDLTAEGDEGMRGRYPIRSAIFNWSSDTDPKKFGRKNTGMFKRIVSGEPIPYRKLGENVLESSSIPYLVFNLNELPFPEDASLGFIRRLQYISFDVVIPPDRRNPQLASLIIQNELSGVFNWVYRGMKEVRRRKFQFPAAEGSKRQLMLLLLGSQPILAWLRAYSLRNAREAKNEVCVYVKAGVLYDSFVQFCRDNDLDMDKIPTQQKFGRVLWDKCSFFKKRTPQGMMYETYGCSESDLSKHVLISSDGYDIEDERVEGLSFIKDDD